MSQKLRLSILVLVMGLIARPVAWAQEHPEHPKGSENPQKKDVTLDGLAEAIESWVSEESALQGGYFLYWDAEQKKALVLTLDKVHRDRLAKLKGDVYFACADFKGSDGALYDLDIFMAPDAGTLVATEVKVHKKDGSPRYTWVEEGETWKTKPVN